MEDFLTFTVMKQGDTPVDMIISIEKWPTTEETFYPAITRVISSKHAYNFYPPLEKQAEKLGLVLDYKKLSEALLRGIRCSKGRNPNG